MASLDIPQISLVGVQGDAPPAPSPNNSSSPLPPLGHSLPNTQGFLSPPIPILRNSRNSLDIPSSPASHTSAASYLQPPPSPTLSTHSSGSIRWNSTVLRDSNPEEHDGLSSLGLLTPPWPMAATVSSIRSNFTEDSSGLGLRSGQPDTPNTHSSPNNPHVDAVSHPSRHSSPASFFKRAAQRVRHPSPSSSGDTDACSDTSRHNSVDSVQSGDNADIDRKRVELARPAVLDLKQEVDLNVEPFSFEPLQLAGLVDPKSLENLESLGGLEGLLHGLGSHPLRGLITKLTPPTESPDPATVHAVTPFGIEMSSPEPNIMNTSPTGVPEGLKSTASLGGGSSMGRSSSLKFSAGAYEATLEDRERIYGQNILPRRPSKSLLRLMWLALQDKVIILLSVAAVVSLALGLFQDFGATPEGGPLVDWVEGIAIIAAILIVVTVGSLNDWQKERQFQVFNEKKEDRLVKVIRDGAERHVDVHEVVVGDVALLEPGDVIPCDGILLSGRNVRCDESAVTGESDAIKKVPYEECIALRDKRLPEVDGGPSGDGELPGRADCFIVSGTQVLNGLGSYVVIAVGTKSFNGRIMMASRRDSESTPLQLKLDDLAEGILKIAYITGGLLLVSLSIRYLIELGTNDFQRTPGEMGAAFVNILIISATLVIVALPEGLPLAVTLALAFATKQMSKGNLLVRVLGSCETMANASAICTAKTGTLTQNKMTVVAGTVGVQAKFVRRLEENRKWAGRGDGSGPNNKDTVDLASLNAVIPRPLKDLFNTAIAIDSTAFEDVDPESRAPVFIGNKTESALLGFAKELSWPNYKDTRISAEIVQTIPFSSYRKSMGCVVQLPNGSHRLYVKGASEILAQSCTRHVVLGDAAPSANEVETAPIGEPEEEHISRTITSYASQALRTIALCYRDLPSWPPKGARLLGKAEIDYDDLVTDLTLISVIGIKDPLRTGVREAVAKCGKAGIRVKMCTGDNALTAKSIAEECGIYTAGGIVMEGPHFRTLSPGDMKVIVPRLQVLARSSPEDKRVLVETLKELGDVVGVTGGGTNDGLALKTADVGFSMGISGTEVAKEASDIVLMDDAFPSIVNAIMWGRCVNNSVRKFLQFLISGNVTTVIVMFVWVLASEEEEPILSVLQLLWIKLITGAFAAPALATDTVSPTLLDRKPDKKTDPLFTVDMTKQILGQAIYQVTMILIFHFLGSQILGFHPTDDAALRKYHHDIVRTLVFNALVFAQIFNSFNCQRLDRKLNIFEGTANNWYLMVITAIEVAVHVSICFFGGSTFDVTRMGAREWVISLALGCVPLPLGALIRLIPNEPCERAFRKLQLLPTPELLPTTRPDAGAGSSFAMDHVRGTSAELRRGCMHGSSLVRKRRCAITDADSPRLALVTIPSPDASHVVAPVRQSWRARGSPSGFPSRLSATLWENFCEVHPDTPRDDPVYGLLGTTR